MNIKYNNKFSLDDREIINELILTSITKVKEFLLLPEPLITIYVDEWYTIPEWGVGGAADHTGIDIFLEEGRQADWKKHLPRTIYHECHHFMRGQKRKLDERLIDHVLSEGLATHFEVEVDGKEPSFFTSVLNEDQRKGMVSVFRDEFNDGYDHKRWFFGGGEFPFQAGYDLSHYLVGQFLKSEGKTASELVGVNSNIFKDFLGLD